MKTRILILTILATLFMVACNDDDITITKVDNSGIKASTGTVNFKFPLSLKEKNAFVENLTINVKNVNTGELITHETNLRVLPLFDLEDGLYNISVEGTLAYASYYTLKKKDDEGNIIQKIVTKYTKSQVRGLKEDVEVTGGSFGVDIPMFLLSKSKGFVLSEIYFTGSNTPEKKQYNGDKFFEIYNNSDKVLYADGLCIAETELNSALSLNEYNPDIREYATPVSAVYRVPGSGKEHAIQPGETLVLCDIGINHKNINPNSIDLSKADFEWYDENDYYPDPDTPEVPNMEKMVATSKSIWSLHNRGYKGYILFRPETKISAEQFTTGYAYHYKYHFVFGSFERWMNFDAWKVPNSWVIDAVDCSTSSAFEWKTMSPSLDLTWTHSGDSNDERYGHSVKRKISHKIGERIVLQDTNDSASDFIATAPNPSPGTVEDHK